MNFNLCEIFMNKLINGLDQRAGPEKSPKEFLDEQTFTINSPLLS